MTATNEFRPRLLHTMVRVADLDRALAFWCGELGMRELRRIPFAEQRYTLVFVGYGHGADDPQVELWHDWSRPSTAPTDPLLAAGATDERPARVVTLHAAHAAHAARRAAPFHVGIGVDRIHEFCARLRERGVKVLRDPAPMRPGGRVIALIEDPDGNEVELLG
jgi:lactoylglutathione lyase